MRAQNPLNPITKLETRLQIKLGSPDSGLFIFALCKSGVFLESIPRKFSYATLSGTSVEKFRSLPLRVFKNHSDSVIHCLNSISVPVEVGSRLVSVTP